jgi:hypothetical protein
MVKNETKKGEKKKEKRQRGIGEEASAMVSFLSSGWALLAQSSRMGGGSSCHGPVRHCGNSGVPFARSWCPEPPWRAAWLAA